MSTKIHKGDTSPRDRYLSPISFPSPIAGSCFKSPNTKKETVTKVALEVIKQSASTQKEPEPTK